MLFKSAVPVLVVGLLVLAVPARAGDGSCDGLQATVVGTLGDDTDLPYTDRSDVVALLSGDHVYYAGPGRDHVCGDAGGDVILTGPGRDVVFANKGNDSIVDGDVRSGADTLYGGGGEDGISGGDGDDYLNGQAGSDQLYGNRGADRVIGSHGDDYLDVSGDQANTDVVNGGRGIDQCFVNPEDKYKSCEYLTIEF